MGIDSFKAFMLKIDRLDRKSLILTKEVLKEREKLEFTINKLQPKIQKGLDKMN